MNDLILFSNEQFGEIRTVMVDNEPWFVGKDIAEALGYKNPQDAVRNHVDDEDKGVSEFLTPGGKQKIPIINESGLYSLVLTSKLETAKAFKRWITHEVIPSIRKTGGYQMQPRTPNEMFLMQAQINVENERKLSELETRLEETNRRLTETVEVFRTRTLNSKDDWQKDMNGQVNEIVETYGLNHQGFRKRLYQMLEVQQGIDLERRRANFQKRLRAGGAMYREIHDVSKLQVIAQDTKLRAAFELLVKQEAAAYAMSGREQQ